MTWSDFCNFFSMSSGMRFAESDTAQRLRAAADLLRLTDQPDPGVGEGPQELMKVYAAALVEKAQPA